MTFNYDFPITPLTELNLILDFPNDQLLAIDPLDESLTLLLEFDRVVVELILEPDQDLDGHVVREVQ